MAAADNVVLESTPEILEVKTNHEYQEALTALKNLLEVENVEGIKKITCSRLMSWDDQQFSDFHRCIKIIAKDIQQLEIEISTSLSDFFDSDKWRFVSALLALDNFPISLSIESDLPDLIEDDAEDPEKNLRTVCGDISNAPRLKQITLDDTDTNSFDDTQHSALLAAFTHCKSLKRFSLGEGSLQKSHFNSLCDYVNQSGLNEVSIIINDGMNPSQLKIYSEKVIMSPNLKVCNIPDDLKVFSENNSVKHLFKALKKLPSPSERTLILDHHFLFGYDKPNVDNEVFVDFFNIMQELPLKTLDLSQCNELGIENLGEGKFEDCIDIPRLEVFCNFLTNARANTVVLTGNQLNHLTVYGEDPSRLYAALEANQHLEKLIIKFGGYHGERNPTIDAIVKKAKQIVKNNVANRAKERADTGMGAGSGAGSGAATTALGDELTEADRAAIAMSAGGDIGDDDIGDLEHASPSYPAFSLGEAGAGAGATYYSTFNSGAAGPTYYNQGYVSYSYPQVMATSAASIGVDNGVGAAPGPAHYYGGTYGVAAPSVTVPSVAAPSVNVAAPSVAAPTSYYADIYNAGATGIPSAFNMSNFLSTPAAGAAAGAGAGAGVGPALSANVAAGSLNPTGASIGFSPAYVAATKLAADKAKDAAAQNAARVTFAAYANQNHGQKRKELPEGVVEPPKAKRARLNGN